MKTPRACILIYNPISGHGHLDSWNAIVASLLLHRDFHVLALTPDATALEERLSRQGLADHAKFRILDWNARPRERYSHRARDVSSWLLRKLPWSRRSDEAAQAPSLENDPERDYLHPVNMAERIQAALETAPWTPDCMFNMYMDYFRTTEEPWRRFDSNWKLPWAGIRFVPSPSPPPEAYFGLESLRGMCFLNETLCADYSRHFPDKTFTYLPDVTNAELPETTPPLAKQVLERAAGRKIVFSGGSIGGQKNIARWCELAARADPKRWFFVKVGEMHLNTFSEDDRIALDRLTANPPENVFLHTVYVPDERDFNALIRLSDVIFAVYKNFTISSNMPMKAACFERPILASDGYMMGERVRRFGIGLTVPENDSGAMLEALETLASHPVPAQNFAAFRAEFSLEAMGARLVNLFEQISAKRGAGI